jgi:hypothetical protein
MLFFVPIWVTNVLFLLSCMMSGHQHSRLNRENPITTIQFGNIIFCVVMVVVVVLSTKFHPNPRMSQVFFLIAAITLCLTIRRYRMLPPKKAY